MDRHCDQLVSRGEPGPALRALLRLAGVALMLFALWLCTGLWGGAVGIIVWLAASVWSLWPGYRGLSPQRRRWACAA